MKTLVLIIVSLIIGTLSALSQTTTTKTSSTSSEVTVSVDGDTEEESYYRSFSIINTDNNYRIKIHFMEFMQMDVKSFLIQEFGQNAMVVDGPVFLWNKKIADNEVYEVRLKGNRLRINVSKELASDKQITRFKNLAKELKSITANALQN